MARETIPADACFVFIGAAPRTDWLDGVLARDARGFILAGRDVQTNGWPLPREPYILESTVPGVFVAGDVRARSIKRVASAVGEGSMAVSLIHEYLVEGVSDARDPGADVSNGRDTPAARAGDARAAGDTTDPGAGGPSITLEELRTIDLFDELADGGSLGSGLRRRAAHFTSRPAR